MQTNDEVPYPGWPEEPEGRDQLELRLKKLEGRLEEVSAGGQGLLERLLLAEKRLARLEGGA